jgi:hypothetical protein
MQVLPVEAAPPPLPLDVERAGLLRAIEELEGLMAALERSLLGELPAFTPVPGALRTVALRLDQR